MPTLPAVSLTPLTLPAAAAPSPHRRAPLANCRTSGDVRSFTASATRATRSSIRSTPNGMPRNLSVILPALPLAIALIAGGCATGGATASTPGAPTTQVAPAAGWGQHTAGLERRDGFVPVWISPDGGKLHLELPADSLRALLHVKQATGLGSNPIGIDRGSTGGAQVVRFERVGDRMLVIFENWRYRSSLEDTLHQRSLRENFPVSTVAALPILASRDGRSLV